MQMQLLVDVHLSAAHAADDAAATAACGRANIAVGAADARRELESGGGIHEAKLEA